MVANARTLVVGTDFSQGAEAALEAVQWMSRVFKVRRVHLVHVVETASWISPTLVAYGELLEMAMEAAQERLLRVGLEVPASVEVTREARIGAPAKELAEAAESAGASMLVLATHGRSGLARAMLGSVTSDLVRVSNVPVFVVPVGREFPDSFGRVVAAVDLSPVSARVVEAASDWVDHCPESRLQVVSMYDHPVATVGEGEMLPHYPSPEEIEKMGDAVRTQVDQLVRRYGPKSGSVDVEVLSRSPAAQVILDVSELTQAEMIVVGTSGHSVWQRLLLGTTATRVLNEAHRPVLVIPHALPEQGREAVSASVGLGGPGQVLLGASGAIMFDRRDD